jgi:formate/nitrite transporter FocA (FNT family)
LSAAPQAEEIYERTREEGRRRLSRPVLELAATAVVGGFDVALGIAVYGLTAAAVAPKGGEGLAHLAGAIGFGIAFVFIVVGRSELFTENFLVPITGLRGDRGSFLKLGELWAVSLVMNIVGGFALTMVLTSEGVLRQGSKHEILQLAEHTAHYTPLTAFLSAIVAGALMTVLTWFVEGAAESMGVRITMAWIIGAVLVLGSFNHAIVGAIEMFYGLRFVGPISWDDLFSNLGIAIAGNLVGGLVLVTFARSAQVIGSNSG